MIYASIDSKYMPSIEELGVQDSSKHKKSNIMDAIKSYFSFTRQVTTDMLIIAYSETQSLMVKAINNFVTTNRERLPPKVTIETAIGGWNLWFKLARCLYSSTPQKIRFYSNSYKIPLPTSVKEYLQSSEIKHSI